MTMFYELDIETRRQGILAVPGHYAQDGLISIHDHAFMEEPGFARAYARGVRAAGADYLWHWRVHIGLWAASVASRVPGDFVECGVNAGFLSSAIMEHLDFNRLDRNFWLLDTFKGIDPSRVTEAERAEGILEKNEKLLDNGFYVTDLEAVRRNFAEWPRARLVPGSIPGTLPQVKAERVAFLHQDLNCAQPEVEALSHFWDRLSPGAPVLLDDYAYCGYRQQKLAFDELAAKLGVAIASLPTGQGLILRP